MDRSQHPGLMFDITLQPAPSSRQDKMTDMTKLCLCYSDNHQPSVYQHMDFISSSLSHTRNDTHTQSAVGTFITHFNCTIQQLKIFSTNRKDVMRRRKDHICFPLDFLNSHVATSCCTKERKKKHKKKTKQQKYHSRWRSPYFVCFVLVFIFRANFPITFLCPKQHLQAVAFWTPFPGHLMNTCMCLPPRFVSKVGPVV